MNTIHFRNGDRHMFDRVEIMSNGWVKAIEEHETHENECMQYPPDRIEGIAGEVIYYE